MKLQKIQRIFKAFILFLVAIANMAVFKLLMDRATHQIACSVDVISRAVPGWFQVIFSQINRMVTPDALIAYCRAVAIGPLLLGMSAVALLSGAFTTWVLSRDIPQWWFQKTNRDKADKVFRDVQRLKFAAEAVEFNALDDLRERQLRKLINALGERG